MGNRNIQDLSRDVYYNMGRYSQLTIDLVEEIEELLENVEGEKPSNQIADYLGSKSYEVGNIKDICRKDFACDYEAIEDLERILNEKINEIKSSL